MRSQNRKIVQAPMKSPSPDIANRSIITNTKSPVNQIKDYIRMREKSTSPKSLSGSFHQISKSGPNHDEQQFRKIQRHVQELQAKLQYMEKIKISHDQLTIINQRLSSELAELRQQIRNQTMRSGTGSPHNLSPKSTKNVSPKANGFKGVSLVKNALQNANPQLPLVQPVQNDTILRQFNERIVKISQQNKRLSKKLKQIKEQKDILQLQNMRLRDMSQQGNKSGRSAIGAISIGQAQSLKRHFAQQSQRLTNYHQSQIDNKLRYLNGRFISIQQTFSKISQRTNLLTTFNRHSNSPHQQKANLSIDTNFRSDYQDHQPSTLGNNRYEMAESKYTVSPSDVRAFTLDTSPIRALEEEKFRIKSENDKLANQITNLQIKLKQILTKYGELGVKYGALQSQYQLNLSIQPKTMADSNSSTISKFYQQKCQALQLDLKNRVSEMSFKDLRIQELQKRLQDINKFFETSIKNYQINLQQEKDKNVHYQAEIQQLQQKIQQLNDKSRKTDIRLQQLDDQSRKTSQQKQLLIEAQNQLRHIKTKYSEILQTYNHNKTNFQKYLQMVLQIRYSITGQGVDRCLTQVQNKWQQYDELQLEITKISECYQMLIKNLRKINLEKDQRIAQLQKKNQIMSKTIDQINIERERLKQAILEYKLPIQTTVSQQQIKRKVYLHQSAHKNKEPCVIREYINRTFSKIETLEKQIDSAIKSHKQPNRPVSTNRYFNDVQVDSFYRPTVKSNVKSTQFTPSQFKHQQSVQNKNYTSIPDDPSLLEEEQAFDHHQ